MKRTLWRALLVAGLVLATATVASATVTHVTVRVLAKDAKFVGSGMGGALVTIRDADTGELMATGLTSGSTGNTNLLMKKPITRRTSLADDHSAKFTAALDIDRPRRIEISALGPMAQRQSANTVSVTQWVLPGKDIVEGNAVLLELPGLAVEVLNPPTPLHLKGAPVALEIQAHVTMMCGCPLTPGGLWDADGFEIKAEVSRDGEPAGEVTLAYAGKASAFVGTYTAEAPGTYQVTVTAFDPKTGNTGVDMATFEVSK